MECTSEAHPDVESAASDPLEGLRQELRDEQNDRLHKRAAALGRRSGPWLDAAHAAAKRWESVQNYSLPVLGGGMFLMGLALGPSGLRFETGMGMGTAGCMVAFSLVRRRRRR